MFRDFLKHFGRVALRVRLLPHVAYFRVRPNPVRHAHDSEEGLAEKTFHAPRAVDFDGVEVRVRKQRKIQIVLRLEFRLLFHGIRAASQNHRVQLLEFFLGVAKLGRFIRSTGRERLGKKEEDHVFAAEIRERHLLAVIGGQIEFRSPLANFQYVAHLRFLFGCPILSARELWARRVGTRLQRKPFNVSVAALSRYR